jgi:hypothetical protein
VSFLQTQPNPIVYHVPDFATRAAQLSIDDLSALDVALDYH